MTSPASDTVELRTGVLIHLADARVGVMGIDGRRIKLGVVEPDGTEHIAWYTEDEVVAASGRAWRVSRVSEPEAPPGEEVDEIVAVLTSRPVV